MAEAKVRRSWVWASADEALFVDHYGADAAFLQDIGMEAKGLEYSEYVTKESLASRAATG